MNYFKKQNKKAQIFTILSIVLILLMFVSFEVFSLVRERQAIQTRVSSMESFLSSVEDNLGRQLYISAYRIIFVANSQIASSGTYIDVDNFFDEAFFNGTVNGQNESLLFQTTYTDMVNSINSKATKINVIVNMSNSNISIFQEDPWFVKVVLTSDFEMRDRSNLASWNRTQNISAYIPVTEFYDPLYTIGTFGQVAPRKINKTIYEGNYVTGCSVTNLSSHASLGLFTNNSLAPSFLNRLEGNFSADPNGIESFVNTDYLDSQGFSVNYASSSIDYIYFGVQTSGSHPAGTPSWVKIDAAHQARYQVTSLSGCPS